MATEVPPQIREALLNKSPSELIQMARQTRALNKQLALEGPRNDDELHAWLKKNLQIDIPRVAVCDHHDAPFKFLADLYFERSQSALLMANRGGSKTFLVAVLHLLNSLFKPGIESATVGAIEMQARRCYMHLGKLIERYDAECVMQASMIETKFKNGSRVEILPGTISAVNGPHPQKVHADEVELMDPEVFDESRNMSTGAVVNGRNVRAQDIITSTRKRGHGPMQKLLDEIHDAKIAGHVAPYNLYQWCIFEAAAPVPNCQISRPDLPEEEKCPCHDVVKGRWENGTARRFVHVCGGRLAKSDGWISLNDIINTFTKTSVAIWEAQQECIKPSTEGLVVPAFSRERCGLRKWEPRLEHGPVFMSVDFGGTNPHAVNWYQVLTKEVVAQGFNGRNFTLSVGTRVCFDEVYKSEIGNVKLAKLVVSKESAYREKYGKRWRVVRRFADPAAKAARLDWAKNSPPLPTVYKVTREIPEHIKEVVNLVDDEHLYVDVDKCPMWCEEMEAWHYPPPKGDFEYDPEVPVDDFNHCMSNLRYAMANIAAIEKSIRRNATTPAAGATVHQTAKNKNIPGKGGGGTTRIQAEKWRGGLGGPAGF